MKKKTWMIGMICTLSLCGAMAHAQEEGFISLFDGKSFDGWQKAKENEETFTLQDGCFVAHGPRCHLFYVGDVLNHNFKNFILKVDVMTKPNSNGGIFIHTQYQEQGWPSHGYEVQVNNSFKPDPRLTGSLYNTQDVMESYAKDNEWFTEEVLVWGDHIVIKVNDKVVVNYIEPEDAKKNPKSLSSGTFALQGHDPGSTDYYKNIRVKPLPDSPEWQPLFNGKDLEGWKQLNGTAKYIVEDGAIVGTTVEGSPNSFLCTEKNYSDFELEFQVKVDPRMNSGVQIRSESTPDYQNGRVHGYQVEIDPSERAWSGGIYDEARRGWLYKLEGDENAKARTAFKNNEWNTYRVVCYGDHFLTWINGIPCADLHDDMTKEGFIALQVHQFKGDTPASVSWRNIRIRDLSQKN